MATSFKSLHAQVSSLENVIASARFHSRWETHAVCLHEERAT